MDMCRNPRVGFIGVSDILQFRTKFTSYRHILNYLEDRFNIETYHGFISSYAAIGGIIADVFLIPFFAKVFRTQISPMRLSQYVISSPLQI